MRKSAKIRRKKGKTPAGYLKRLKLKLNTKDRMLESEAEENEPREAENEPREAEKEREIKPVQKRQKFKQNSEQRERKSIPEQQKSNASLESQKKRSKIAGLRFKLNKGRKRINRNLRQLIRNVDVGKIKSKRTMLILGVALLVVLIGVLGSRVAMNNYLERHKDGTILAGVSIDGVDVSGMTQNQALEEIRSKLAIYQESSISFRIENRGSFSGTLGDIGLSIEGLNGVINEALEYGQERSLGRRVRLQRRANRGRLDVDIPLNYRISLSELTEFLKSHMEAHLNTPVNARIESGANGVNIIPDQAGEIFEVELVYYEISHYINRDWDRTSASFTLEVIKEDAEVVAEQLRGITDLLGTFTTTFFDSNESRAQNVENGAAKINHLFIVPGEEISACNLMGPYTVENGYAYGSMFIGNLTVDAIGGGICQVASTLYNALLYAEIEILQRNAHSMPVNYVRYSRDAAIAEGLLDLRFRNNMNTPIYIEAVIVPGESITYNIFGRETRPANRRIEFISEAEYGDVPQGTQFIATEYGIGAMWIVSEARAPITARLIKVIFIDDVEVERVQVNSSHYMESPRIWEVGTGSPNPDSTALMLGAIGSQNYDTIRNTISQILTGWHPSDYTGSGQGGYAGGYVGGYTGEYTGGYPGEYSGGY